MTTTKTTTTIKVPALNEALAQRIKTEKKRKLFHRIIIKRALQKLNLKPKDF